MLGATIGLEFCFSVRLWCLVLRRIVLGLAVCSALLPIGIVLVLSTSRLLLTMGDEAGAEGLGRVSLGLGILWAFGLICLLLACALQTLDLKPPAEENEGTEFPGDDV